MTVPEPHRGNQARCHDSAGAVPERDDRRQLTLFQGLRILETAFERSRIIHPKRS
jgi:hypothetical protein